MCIAQTTLFYGLWVTTASLNFAAAAHQATCGPVHAIDIIVNRRRAGKLEVEGQGERTTARGLPEEVWGMVKHELLGVAVREAEKDTLDRLRCEDCVVGYWAERTRTTYEKRNAWNRWSVPQCSECLRSLAASELTCRRSREALEDVERLVQAYGLVLPSDRILHQDPELPQYDTYSLSAIALPPRVDGAGPPLTVTSEDEYGSPGGISSTLAIAEIYITPPFDARRRFRRLVKDYRLDLGDCPQDTSVPPNITTSSNKARAVTLGGGEGSWQPLDGEEPRWMLWSLCEACY